MGDAYCARGVAGVTEEEGRGDMREEEERVKPGPREEEPAPTGETGVDGEEESAGATSEEKMSCTTSLCQFGLG